MFLPREKATCQTLKPCHITSLLSHCYSFTQPKISNLSVVRYMTNPSIFQFPITHVTCPSHHWLMPSSPRMHGSCYWISGNSKHEKHMSSGASCQFSPIAIGKIKTLTKSSTIPLEFQIPLATSFSYESTPFRGSNLVGICTVNGSFETTTTTTLKLIPPIWCILSLRIPVDLETSQPWLIDDHGGCSSATQ